MSELRLVIMDKDCPQGEISCGVKSIDELIQEAYGMTVFKQALAYNIMVDGHLIGNCMVKLVWLYDQEAEYYMRNQEYIALEISYLAIAKRVQKHGIGSRVLEILIRYAREMSEKLPIRFLVLDAFEDKEEWYTKFGFKFYPKQEDSRYPGTIPMRMDLIDISLAEEYMHTQI